MSDGQMHLAGKREGIRGELRRNVLGQLKDQIYLEDEQLYDQIDAVIRQKGREVYLPLKERLWLRNSLYDSFRRLDILQELLDDKEVTEIMINGAGKIFIEKKGKMLLWNRRFEKTEQLEDIIQQIVGKVNRIVNVSSPIADARLEDGSRVHIVLPPVALDGPVVTIRKFPEPVTIETDPLSGDHRRSSSIFRKAGGSTVQHFCKRRHKLGKNHIFKCIVFFYSRTRACDHH